MNLHHSAGGVLPGSFRPKVAVFHPWMNVAGSECTTLWTLEALLAADKYEVALVCPEPPDLDVLNQAFGTSVDPNSLRLIHFPSGRGAAFARRLPLLWIQRFHRLAKVVSRDFDLCISGYNLTDFARPGLQLIGDFSFDPEYAEILDRDGVPISGLRSRIRSAYRWLVRRFLGGAGLREMAARGDSIVANSHWTARVIAERYRIPRPPVLYPPVFFDAPDHIGGETDTPLFVCIGRISPEKRIERIVAILAAVRERGAPVRLRIVGEIGSDPYGESIRRLVEENEDWIESAGLLVGEEKIAALATADFGIQGRECEPFGIGIGEMIKAGCIVFCPRSGGQFEIVGHESLGFSDDEDAVDKILYLLSDPERQKEMQEYLAERVDRFGARTFVREIQAMVEGYFVREEKSERERRELVAAR